MIRLLWLVLALGAIVVVLVGALTWYSIVFPRQPFQGPLPPLTSDETELSRRLREHVTAIASKPHNIDLPADLEAAASYIEATLIGLGYTPQRQEYTERGKAVRNIEVVIEPTEPKGDVETYVVGGHYDSVGFSPGANDNGTGTSATLELARLLHDLKPRETRLRLVFWVNEEYPFGKTPRMGSYIHAKALQERGERVAGAISLETIGYFSDQPGSQKFPSPFDLIYEDRGNFVAFVGLPGSRSFVHRALNAFRRHAAFPSIGGVAPDFIAGIGNSDHWSYHQFGYPSVMVTDTAPFRNPQYHRTTDLPDTVDYDSLARVTKGVEGMVRELVK
jgi:peptidase M28-like protein